MQRARAQIAALKSFVKSLLTIVSASLPKLFALHFELSPTARDRWHEFLVGNDKAGMILGSIVGFSAWLSKRDKMAERQ